MRRLIFSLIVCAVVATAADAAVEAYTIAILPKSGGGTSNFWGSVFEGCDARAARELEGNNARIVECRRVDMPEADADAQAQILEGLIDDPNVDAIAVSVLDPESSARAIRRGIKEARKPIITFDSDAPDSNRLAYVGTNNFEMGRELAKLLRQIKPEGGTYGILSGLGPNLEERVRGVRERLGEEKSEWVEISPPEGDADSAKNGSEDVQTSLDKMWELVEENPGIGAIVSVMGLVRTRRRSRAAPPSSCMLVRC